MFDYDTQIFTLTAEATIAQVAPYCRFSLDGGVSMTQLSPISSPIVGNVMTLEFGEPFPYGVTLDVDYTLQGETTQRTLSVSVPAAYVISNAAVVNLGSNLQGAWVWTLQNTSLAPANVSITLMDGVSQNMNRSDSAGGDPNLLNDGEYDYVVSNGLVNFAAKPTSFQPGDNLQMQHNGLSLSIPHPG